jgi:hypothetical protein
MTILPNLSRRQLLSTAATAAVAGIAPSITFDAHARSEIAPQAQALAPSSKEAHVQNFSAVTLLRMREIAERNRVRQEAGLPLLSLATELRRMKDVADDKKFRTFTEAHRDRIYEKMLARVRRQCCDPQWAPTGVLSGGGLWFDAQVNEQLTKPYCRLAVVPELPSSYLTLRHSRSTKTLSRQAPLPSMLMAIAFLISTPVKAAPVNWLP